MQHATPKLEEADRLMTVCNSCRYCEGLCAVFPAMEIRESFVDQDLNYLANLCHACGACFTGCQFSPPHEFNVNVPATLQAVRNESYGHYTWPPRMAAVFRANVAFVTTVCFASTVIFFTAIAPSAVTGNFYLLIPHNTMVLIFGFGFLFAVFAIAMGVRNFFRTEHRDPAELSPIWQALKDAATLRYLDGGGVGCSDKEEKATDPRRLFHHMTFYGFLLCLASTSVATVYHYAFGAEAPYQWSDLPKLLGIVGGIGLIVGPLGLLWAKMKRKALLQDNTRTAADNVFVVTLLLVSVSGFLLWLLRDTSGMSGVLALHLGLVFGFFLTMPYSKFVHGIYRFCALVRYARERRSLAMEDSKKGDGA